VTVSTAWAMPQSAAEAPPPVMTRRTAVRLAPEISMICARTPRRSEPMTYLLLAHVIYISHAASLACAKDKHTPSTRVKRLHIWLVPNTLTCGRSRYMTDPTRPLYAQVADELRQRIRSGELPPGSLVPANRDLAAAQGISRGTAEKAISLLV